MCKVIYNVCRGVRFNQLYQNERTVRDKQWFTFKSRVAETQWFTITPVRMKHKKSSAIRTAIFMVSKYLKGGVGIIGEYKFDTGYLERYC